MINFFRFTRSRVHSFTIIPHPATLVKGVLKVFSTFFLPLRRAAEVSCIISHATFFVKRFFQTFSKFFSSLFACLLSAIRTCFSSKACLLYHTSAFLSSSNNIFLLVHLVYFFLPIQGGYAPPCNFSFFRVKSHSSSEISTSASTSLLAFSSI